MTKRDAAVLNGPMRSWLGWANAMRHWHRYEVEGLEHLDGPKPKLILGYHGRGWASDLIILNAVLFERHGEIPISILHTYYSASLYGRWMCSGLRNVTEEGPELEAALADGRHLVILPGGNREANRPFWVRYVVDWGKRTGFIRLALKYDLEVVMVAAAGTDWATIGLNDGYEAGKRKNRPHNLPAWAGIGFFAPAVFGPNIPVKLRQLIAPPIDLKKRYDNPDPNDKARLLEVQRDLRELMQAHVDKARLSEGGWFNTKAGSPRE